MLKSRRLSREENMGLLVSVAIAFEVLWCSSVLLGLFNVIFLTAYQLL